MPQIFDNIEKHLLTGLTEFRVPPDPYTRVLALSTVSEMHKSVWEHRCRPERVNVE